jgi:hypothetical protein
MKQGIHLGPPRGRRSLLSLALFLAAVGAVALGILSFVVRRDVVRLREELERSSGGESSASPGSSGDGQRAAALLDAVLESGALDAIRPTEVLSMLQSTLPDEMVLVSLSIATAPPSPSLLVEALADEAGQVTLFERRVAGSPLVAATKLLEERRSPDGRLAVRLSVDLTRKAAR